MTLNFSNKADNLDNLNMLMSLWLFPSNPGFLFSYLVLNSIKMFTISQPRYLYVSYITIQLDIIFKNLFKGAQGTARK